MEKKLSDLTVIELKSLAYDELARVDQSQANLRILNQEINNRIQQAQQAQQAQQGSFTNPLNADSGTEVTV
jgi:hypothetical protein